MNPLIFKMWKNNCERRSSQFLRAEIDDSLCQSDAANPLIQEAGISLCLTFLARKMTGTINPLSKQLAIKYKEGDAGERQFNVESLTRLSNTGTNGWNLRPNTDLMASVDI